MAPYEQEQPLVPGIVGQMAAPPPPPMPQPVPPPMPQPMAPMPQPMDTTAASIGTPGAVQEASDPLSRLAGLRSEAEQASREAYGGGLRVGPIDIGGAISAALLGAGGAQAPGAVPSFIRRMEQSRARGAQLPAQRADAARQRFMDALGEERYRQEQERVGAREEREVSAERRAEEKHKAEMAKAGAPVPVSTKDIERLDAIVRDRRMWDPDSPESQAARSAAVQRNPTLADLPEWGQVSAGAMAKMKLEGEKRKQRTPGMGGGGGPDFDTVQRLSAIAKEQLGTDTLSPAVVGRIDAIARAPRKSRAAREESFMKDLAAPKKGGAVAGDAQVKAFEEANPDLQVAVPSRYLDVINKRGSRTVEQEINTVNRAMHASARMIELDRQYAAIPVEERLSKRALELANEYDYLRDEHQGIILKISGQGAGDKESRQHIKEGLPDIRTTPHHFSEPRLKALHKMLVLNGKANLMNYGVGMRGKGGGHGGEKPRPKAPEGAVEYNIRTVAGGPVRRVITATEDQVKNLRARGYIVEVR